MDTGTRRHVDTVCNGTALPFLLNKRRYSTTHNFCVHEPLLCRYCDHAEHCKSRERSGGHVTPAHIHDKIQAPCSGGYPRSHPLVGPQMDPYLINTSAFRWDNFKFRTDGQQTGHLHPPSCSNIWHKKFVSKLQTMRKLRYCWWWYYCCYFYYWNGDNVVGTDTRLRAGWSEVRIAVRSGRFYLLRNVQDSFRNPTSLLLKVYRRLLARE